MASGGVAPEMRRSRDSGIRRGPYARTPRLPPPLHALVRGCTSTPRRRGDRDGARCDERAGKREAAEVRGLVLRLLSLADEPTPGGEAAAASPGEGAAAGGLEPTNRASCCAGR